MEGTSPTTYSIGGSENRGGRENFDGGSGGQGRMRGSSDEAKWWHMSSTTTYVDQKGEEEAEKAPVAASLPLMAGSHPGLKEGKKGGRKLQETVER
jgi:hypothetical protein